MRRTLTLSLIMSLFVTANLFAVGEARMTGKILDAATKKPVTGAKLGKLKVPSNGVLKLKADKKGTFIFKAEAPDSIRSNAVVVKIKAAKKK